MAITVRVDIDSEALREDIGNLLFRYSEWLDSEQGLMKKPKAKDTRSHTGLVDEFLGPRLVSL
jgi:hypothetical protein